MRAQSSPLVVFSTKMNGWLFTPWTLQCIRRTQPSVRGMLCSQSRSAARGPLSALDVARRASVSWSSERTLVDDYYSIGERLKLKGESENMCTIWAFERRSGEA